MEQDAIVGGDDPEARHDGEGVGGLASTQRDLAEGEQREDRLRGALPGRLDRRLQLTRGRLEVAGDEQVLAEIAEGIGDPDRRAELPRDPQLLVVQRARLAHQAAFGQDAAQRAERVRRPLEMAELAGDVERAGRFVIATAVLAECHPEVGDGGPHESLVAPRLQRLRDLHATAQAGQALVGAPRPRVGGAERDEGGDLGAAVTGRAQQVEGALELHDGGVGVAGELQVHGEDLLRARGAEIVAQLLEERQRRLQLAAALRHAHEVQQHHADLRAGLGQPAAIVGRLHDAHGLPGQLDPSSVILVAAPQRAQRGQDARLGDRVAVAFGQRQRGLEVLARGLEVPEHAVHAATRLEQRPALARREAGALGRAQRVVVTHRCLAVGPGAPRRLRRAPRRLHRLRPRLRLQVVMREHGRHLGAALGVEAGQRVGGRAVQRAAAGRDERAVRDLLRQRVLEDVDPLVGVGALVQELQACQLLQLGVQPLGRFADGAQQPLGELPAEDGGRLQRLLGAGRQPIDARGQHALHRIGHRQPAGAGVGQHVRQLLEEERVALAPVQDQPRARVVGGQLGQQRADDVEAVGAPQRRQRQLGGVRAVEPGRPVARPVRGHHEDRGAADALRQPGQARLRGAVDPVQVLEQQHERVAPARAQPALA